MGSLVQVFATLAALLQSSFLFGSSVMPGMLNSSTISTNVGMVDWPTDSKYVTLSCAKVSGVNSVRAASDVDYVYFRIQC
jgi:hypothetical protein